MAVFMTNGARATVMQSAIAEMGAAAYEEFTGKPLAPPEKPKKPAVTKAVKKHAKRRT